MFVKSGSMGETYLLKHSIYILQNVRYVFVFNYISSEELLSFKIVDLIVNMRKDRILSVFPDFWICLQCSIALFRLTVGTTTLRFKLLQPRKGSEVEEKYSVYYWEM